MNKQELRNGLVEALMQTEYLNEWYGMHGLIMMIEALDKDIKYEWHDLRKNPNDFPKEDYADCVCLVLYEDGCEEYRSYYWDECKFSGLTTDIKVLAWKYIEPFNDGR